jgi:hypothetical protein
MYFFAREFLISYLTSYLWKYFQGKEVIFFIFTFFKFIFDRLFFINPYVPVTISFYFFILIIELIFFFIILFLIDHP